MWHAANRSDTHTHTHNKLGEILSHFRGRESYSGCISIQPAAMCPEKKASTYSKQSSDAALFEALSIALSICYVYALSSFACVYLSTAFTLTLLQQANAFCIPFTAGICILCGSLRIFINISIFLKIPSRRVYEASPKLPNKCCLKKVIYWAQFKLNIESCIICICI